MRRTPATVTSRSPSTPLATPPASAPAAMASVSAVRAVAESASPLNRTRFTNTGPPMTAVASV